MKEHFREIAHGFEWGSAILTRGFSDDRKGWVTLILRTPKEDIQTYVTKTGKVRMHNSTGEYKKP